VRTNSAHTGFSDILPEELEHELKEASQISMGTEISDEDIENITALCDQVIAISEYREQLYDYLKNRMAAIAPNLTILVGDLVGARLIAHAGSLLNLAKHPASTVQILGAEKALFRALKTKHETPKYGLIYHASLIGQAAPKFKGKISRVLAAKTSLAARVDALGEGETSTALGVESRIKVEQRLKNLEGGQTHKLSGTGKGKSNTEKYDYKKDAEHQPKTTTTYNTNNDSTLESPNNNKQQEIPKKKKRENKQEEQVNGEEEQPKKKKKSKDHKEKDESKEEEKPTEKKKRKSQVSDETETPAPEEPEKKKKKKKSKE